MKKLLIVSVVAMSLTSCLYTASRLAEEVYSEQPATQETVVAEDVVEQVAAE